MKYPTVSEVHTADMVQMYEWQRTLPAPSTIEEAMAWHAISQRICGDPMESVMVPCLLGLMMN